MSVESLSIAEEFIAHSQDFVSRARRAGLADADRYYWYHTIDLDDGIVAPGLYDYRDTNLSCLIQVLRKLGFDRVEQTGTHRGVLRPAGFPFERAILRAANR